MSYNAKNYTEQGGEVTHIGGKLVIEDGAEIEGLPAPEIPIAENQADSEATSVATLKDDFNALLAKLKTAGLMEADEEETESPEQPETPGDDEPEVTGGNTSGEDEDGDELDE